MSTQLSTLPPCRSALCSNVGLAFAVSFLAGLFAAVAGPNIKAIMLDVNDPAVRGVALALQVRMGQAGWGSHFLLEPQGLALTAGRDIRWALSPSAPGLFNKRQITHIECMLPSARCWRAELYSSSQPCNPSPPLLPVAPALHTRLRA